MIIFEVAGKRYRITFAYTMEKNNTVTTHCKMYFCSATADKFLFWFERTAKCNVKDRFCKSCGRKVALKRTLAHARHLSKEIRRGIWNTYFVKTRGCIHGTKDNRLSTVKAMQKVMEAC